MQRSIYHACVVLLIVSSVLLLPREALSMGKDLCLFSEVNGVVVHNGKPVAGAVIEQSYQRGDQRVVAETRTDEKGQFHFDAVVKRLFLASILPHEPVIEQTILIKHQGVTYQAWVYYKGNYRQNGELNGKPISLYCALEAPVKRTVIRSEVDAVAGICELR